MIETIVTAELVHQGQDLSLDANGNKYHLSLTRGGCKYRERGEEIEYAGATSGLLDTYDEAFTMYTYLLKQFAHGDYGWEDRVKMVREIGLRK